jgi:hypothetical protein
MLKIHNLNTVIINHETIIFFYVREKCDPCGNSRFRVYIMDPDGPAVYETIFKCQQFQIAAQVADLIENKIGVNVPF